MNAMRPKMPGRRLRLLVAVVLCVAAGQVTSARAQVKPKPIVIVGLRPGIGRLGGPVDLRRLGEAQRLRRVLDDVVRDLAARPLIDDAGLRTTLGVEYLVDFVDCRGAPGCVARLLARLRRIAPQAVYGEYTADGHRYSFRVRLLRLRRATVEREVEFTLDEADLQDRQLWRRALQPLFAAPGAETSGNGTSGGTTSRSGTSGGPSGSGTKSGGTSSSEATSGGTSGSGTSGGPSGSGTSGGTSGSGTSGGTSGSGTTSGATTENTDDSGDSGVPELAPITTGGGSGSGGTASEPSRSSAPFIDNSVLDAISRGVTWHGHFQSYVALGVRSPFSHDLVTFQDRLQLEFESDISQVRVVGKPQLLFDQIHDNFDVRFREMYAARDYKSVDIAAGEQIAAWGVTDFWPIVDIINPRDYSVIRNWQPIDEKLPVPMLQTTWLVGPVTLHLIGVPVLGTSLFQLDQTKPFAVPIPAPPGTTIVQRKPAADLGNAGGGTRIDVAVAAWKLSLYGLIGRDPFPSVYVQTDPMTAATRFVVDNDRVAMAAVSAVGNLDAIGAIIKAEAAAYDRLDDGCAGMTGMLGSLPECFYLHRVPTARVNIAIEHRILPGLEGHLQFISELTRSADIPQLPVALRTIAPGLPQQYPWNRILTLRLQGNWARGDFLPTAFTYWSIDDQAFFVNLDLEYHLADDFSLAIGGFYFHGYASDPDKNRYTLAGSLAGSSNVYARATAWF